MSEIQIVDDAGNIVEEAPEVVGEPAPPSAPVLPEMQTKAVEQVLGIENEVESSKNRDEVEILLKWAKSKGHTDINDIKWAIRDLGLSVGSPPLGESRIKYLARFAYLQMESDKINEEIEKYNPWGNR